MDKIVVLLLKFVSFIIVPIGESVDGGGVHATFEITVQPFHMYDYCYGVVSLILFANLIYVSRLFV